MSTDTTECKRLL